MRIGTSPTSTTRPLRRQASKALLSSPASPPAAVTITASAPRPPVRSRTPATKSRSLTVKPASSPRACARATRSWRTSTPITTAPAAFSICTVIWPSRPRPSTATRSPRPGSAAAHALQRDRPERAERRLLEGNAVRDERHQVARHHVDARVVGVAGACAGDAIALPDVGDVLAHLDHDARARVAARHLGRDPRPHQLGRRLQAVARYPVHDLLDERGVADRFQHEILAPAAAADAGRLGPGADQRVAGAHQHGARPHHGLRHLDHPDLAAAHRHLQHAALPGGRCW